MRKPKNIVRLSSLTLTLAGLTWNTLPIHSSGRAVCAATQGANSSWRNTGSLSTNRYSHTATRLASGKVLVVAGAGDPCSGGFCYSTVNSSAELYDPATEAWSLTGGLSRRAGHSATLLQNGEVLVAGGHNDAYVNSAQLYDPATGKWRRTGSFTTIQAYNSATLLANGKVLAVGPSGLNAERVVYHAELYDPATGSWSPTGSPSIDGSTILLPNGNVLNVSGNLAELYHPDTGTWSSTGMLNVVRFVGTVTLLRNGKVLVTGGTSEDGYAPGAELFDQSTEAWSITGSPNAVQGTATLLSDGRVLMAGGYDSSNPVIGEQLYDPDTGTWSFTSRLNAASAVHTATLLADGRVLVTGGVDGDFGDFGTIFHSSAELYGPVATPKITSVSISGKKLFIFGEEFFTGAVILLNGQEQKTRNDDQTPRTMLIGKKAGKKIKPGDKLQVRNFDGALSAEFTFHGP